MNRVNVTDAMSSFGLCLICGSELDVGLHTTTRKTVQLKYIHFQMPTFPVNRCGIPRQNSTFDNKSSATAVNGRPWSRPTGSSDYNKTLNIVRKHDASTHPVSKKMNNVMSRKFSKSSTPSNTK